MRDKHVKYRTEARKRIFSLLKEAKELEEEARLKEEKSQDEEMITEPYYSLGESERLSRLGSGDSFMPDDITLEERTREGLHEEAISCEEEAEELRERAKDIAEGLAYNNDSYRHERAAKLRQAMRERNASGSKQPLRAFLKGKSKKRKSASKKSKERE